ncbi:MAG: hypothetical protein WC959_03435 [Kiritimatiellales bacterium]
MKATRRSCLKSGLTATAGILAFSGLQRTFGQKKNLKFTVDDSMTIEELEQTLQAYPPAPENLAKRAYAALSMDKLVHLAVKKDISDKDLKELIPLRDFYLRQVERGLTELENCTVTSGVRIFKFYSSSLVIKSKEGAMAVDFQQGPRLTYCGNPDQPDPVAKRTGFHWSGEQLDRLAKIVDVSFASHPHGDHADYDLSKRLSKLGKPTVVPQQLKELWNSMDHLIVPEYETVQKIGPVEMYTMLGSQYMENWNATKDEKGQDVGHPTTNPDKTPDAETVVLLARLGDLVFLNAAESNPPADEWLRKGIKLGFRPDVLIMAGMRQGARSIREVLKEYPYFNLPVHEYEMGHPRGGNRIAHLYGGANAAAIRTGLAMPLFWGENYALTAKQLPWRK